MLNKAAHRAEARRFGSRRGLASTSFRVPFIPGLESPGFSGQDININKKIFAYPGDAGIKCFTRYQISERKPSASNPSMGELGHSTSE
jgi:hypothetical protein